MPRGGFTRGKPVSLSDHWRKGCVGGVWSAPPLRVVSTTTAEGMPPLASLLRAHAPHHPPRAAFGSPIPHGFAECGEPLLEDGGARRSLCVSVPRGLDPDPGSVAGAPAPGFPAPPRLSPRPLGRLPARRRS